MSKGAKNNYVSRAPGGGQSGTDDIYKPLSQGRQSLELGFHAVHGLLAQGHARLVRVVVTSSTTGWVPFQVMVRSKLPRTGLQRVEQMPCSNDSPRCPSSVQPGCTTRARRVIRQPHEAIIPDKSTSAA